ncbi:MAG: hypothetical protein NC910_01300 [Candidatus Omnitrophica bacterium]|nr:hypothetical protein [Candidatus Omnitrophota bacterium]
MNTKPVFKAAFILSLFSFLPNPVFASDDPVQVKGDQVEFFDNLQKVVASGNVVATYQDSTLTCDQAIIYMATKDAYLRGGVRLSQPGGLVKGEEVVYNFETRKGIVIQPEGTSGPFRSAGERALKVGGTEYLFKNGYISTCDFENPHTRLQAKEISIFLDDKLVLKNVLLYIGGVPVMYLPSYTHPLDDKRPRVTLLPGKREPWGGFLLTSWRAYFNENLQGRVFMDFREKKGVAGGSDLRYELPEGGEGIIRTYFTDEDDVFYFRKDEEEVVKRRYRERVQFRHLWDIDKQTKLTAEVHQAKDATVIKDFFPDEFEADENPQTYLQIIRATPQYGLTFLVRQRVNAFETVTQNWPQINLQLRPIPVPWLPALRKRASSDPADISQPGWYYQSNYDYNHTNLSAEGETASSQIKVSTLQELFYLVKVMNWLNIRPFFQFQTAFFSRRATSPGNVWRQAGAVGFDMSTRFFRVFNIETDFAGMDIHKLRHIINPTITYKFQGDPTVPASSLFTETGGLAKSNTISPSIEQKLQTKRLIEGKWQQVDLARLLLSFPYDLEGPGGSGGRPGNIDMDLETKPYPWLYFESDARFNTEMGQFQTINADILAIPVNDKAPIETTIQGSTGLREYNRSAEGFYSLPWGVGLGWRYQRNTSAQLVFETEFDLDPKWRVGIYQAFDVKRFVTEVDPAGNSRTVKRIYTSPDLSYRLRRDLHEWTGELVFSRARGEGTALLLLFRLKDFPELPIELERHYNQPKAGKKYLR